MLQYFALSRRRCFVCARTLISNFLLYINVMLDLLLVIIIIEASPGQVATPTKV